MNLETLASVCSGLEADFPRESTVSSEMGTVETRSSKTLASSPESERPKSPKEKTIKDVTEGSTEKLEDSDSLIERHVGVDQENGVSDLGETKKIDGNGGVSGEKGLVEENGVSLRENESKGSGDVNVNVNVSETEDVGIEEDKGNGGHEFCVGDLVWGKVKSHPWWPGQIYDVSHASEFAAKMKHKGKHLVAYFGDGTFAWCQPSQLKPFEENFDEMSKQSSMKTFVSAVQQAVDELGRLLEFKMVCSCVPEQNRGELGQLEAENAGVKEGSLVPEGRVRKVSEVLAEPSELLSVLLRIAQAVHETEVLELRVLRSRVSAFYRAKGVCELPQYYDPVPVLGLEDNRKSDVEAPAQGPFEDWLPLSIDVGLAEANQPLLQSCPMSSEGKRTPRRKQRSIADLIAADGTSSGKKEFPSAAKKRKHGEELDEDDNTTLTSLSGKAKRIRLSSVSCDVKDIRGGEAKEGVTSKGRKTKKKDATSNEIGVGENKEEDNNGGLKGDDSAVKPQFEKSPSFRERKKSKYLSPPFTDVNSSKRKKDTETELVSAEDGTKEVNSTPANKTAEPENKDDTTAGPSNERSQDQKTPHQDQDKISNRKKADVSTNELLSEVRSAAADPFTQSGKKSVGMVVDFMSVYRDSVYCNGSNNNADNKSQSRKRKRKTMSESESGSQGKEPKQPVEKSPKTTQSSAVDKSKGKQAVVETHGRKQKQETPTSETKSKGKKAVETSDAKSSGRRNRERETSTPEAKKTKEKKAPKKAKGKEAAKTETPDAKSSGRRKRKQETLAPEAKKAAKGKEIVEESEGKDTVEAQDTKSSGRRKRKRETADPEAKKDKETIEEKTLPATLIVEFLPASTLPTKADLIRMYGKYGELDEIKTDMYYNNQCARVYFLNGVNAEVAFNDSKAVSPFGSTSVKFVLECPSHEYKTRVLKEIAAPEGAAKTKPKKKSKLRENGGGESVMGFVKRKLESISSMLEEKDVKLSPKVKSKLQGEISGLLEKVNTVV